MPQRYTRPARRTDETVMSASQSSQTSIYVGLPTINSETRKSQLQDKLCIYFQKKKVSGCCDVEEVLTVSDSSEGLWLKVVFSEPFGVQHVLAKHHHELCIDGDTIPLEVKAHLPSSRPLVPSDNSDDDMESFQMVQYDDIHIADYTADVQKPAGNTLNQSHSPSQGGMHAHHGKPSSARNAASLTPTTPQTSLGEESSSLSIPSPVANTPPGTLNQASEQTGKVLVDTTEDDLEDEEDVFHECITDVDEKAPSIAGQLSANRTTSQTATQGETDWVDTESEDMYGIGDNIQEQDREKPVIPQVTPPHGQTASRDNRYPPQGRDMQYQGQGSDGSNQQQHHRVGNQNVRGPSIGISVTQDTITQAPSIAGPLSANTTTSQTATQGETDWADTENEDMYGKGDDIQEQDREKPVIPQVTLPHGQTASRDIRYPPQGKDMQYRGQGRDGSNQQQHHRVGNQNVRGPSTGISLTQDTITQMKQDHHLPRDTNQSYDDRIASNTSQAPSIARQLSANTTTSQTATRGGTDWVDTASKDLFGKGDDIQERDREKPSVIPQVTPQHGHTASRDNRYQPQGRYMQYRGQGSGGNNQQQHHRVGNVNVRGPSTGISVTQDTITQMKQDHHLPRDTNQSHNDPIASNTSQVGKGNLQDPQTDRENAGKKKPRKKRPGRCSTEDSSNPDEEEQKEVLQDEQEDDDDDQVVEVKNFNLSTLDDLLKLYFENPRRSGGGDLKTFERDRNTGAIRMIFKDSQVASKVAGRKSHKVDGATLTVKLLPNKKPCPIKKRCLFLKGIPDGCTSELISLFVENQSGMEDPKIQFGEVPGTAICTFSQDIPDVEKVIQKISSKKLQGVLLTADKVHESDCILVQGLSETQLDHIELYFDNKRRSGGSGVRQVEPGPGNGQALVYFEDWKVVGDVLSRSKPHKLGTTEMSVEEYNDCLGRLSPLDAPTPHIPKPVSVGVLDDIMEFIFGKGKHTKKKLTKELTKVKALVHWPDGDNKSKARLEPLLDDGQRQSSWLKWPQTSSAALTDFLGKCKSARIPIPQPLWKDTIIKIEQVDTRLFSIKHDARIHMLFLVGEQQDVDNGTAEIMSVISKLRREAEHNAEQTKQEVDLSPPMKLQLFTMCGVKDKLEESFPNLKINVASSKDKVVLILEGARKNVQEAELLIRRQMDSLAHIEFKTGINKVQFIQYLSDKIHEILGSQNIHAACRGSPDGRIKIYGATTKDTNEAKAYIDQEIEEDVIPVKGQAVLTVLQSERGKKLLDGINKQKFVTAHISQQAGNCIELAGFKTNLNETKQKIITFLKDNVIMKKVIPADKNKRQLITRFHGQDLIHLATQYANNQVKIHPQMSGRNKGFAVQGNEEGLEAVCQSINQLLARIKEQQHPVSKTGMAQLFREEKGKVFLDTVEKNFQCVINENGQEESDDEEERVGGAIKTEVTEVLCRIALPDGCTLRVCRGDLTKQKVDCIVNAANVDLKHVGGLAYAILKAGGSIIQEESDAIIKYRGQIYVGEPVITSSGRLPCKKVIHVAGPKWPHWKAKSNLGKEPTREERLLFDGVLDSLKLANKEKFQSIAIPAISTGVYGFPVVLAANQILNAVAEFCQTVSPRLTEISLTNNDLPTCNVFKQAVMDRFGSFQEMEAAGTDVDIAGAFGAPLVDDVPTVMPPMFTVSGQNILTTKEGITVTMKKGSITTEMVDVLVNTAASNMNLGNGKVSQAILQAAGPALQQECNTLISSRGNIPAGAFLETGPANLGCKNIYHCVCAGYNQIKSEQSLKKLVNSLMEQAETNEMTSIAIPALGTGNLSYPPDVTARAMYESVFDFSRQHPNGVLKDVRFVVYDKDMTTIQGFEDEILSLTTGTVRGAVGGATGFIPATRKLKKPGSASSGVGDRQSYSQIHQDSTGMLQTKIGSVCLQVGQGDIVKETNDSIVNSVGAGLDLTGPVSQAILAIGGDKIKKECDYLRKKEQKKLIYVSSAGNLQCNTIFHVVTPKTPGDIKFVVSKTLQQAEDRKLKSISFPALGTGQAGQGVASCANAILTAVGEFAVGKKPRYLHLIRVVIFQTHMLPGFQDALSKEVGRSYKQQKGLFTKGYEFAKSAWSAVRGDEGTTDGTEDDGTDDELQETIILHICAMDIANVKKAIERISQFETDEYMSEERTDDHGLIEKMTYKHGAEIKSIEKKCSVRIQFPKGKSKRYHVEGQIVNVKDACIKMQELFTGMLKEETDRQQREHLSKEVQWKYSTPSGVECYEPEVNAVIEDAYRKKQPSISLDFEEGKVTIDFQQMKETSLKGSIGVNRVDLIKAATFEMPSNWIPMKARETFKIVPLAPGTPDYTAVEVKFQSTMGAVAVSEIQRIQNKELLMQYQVRQAALEARLTRTNIEETLYHGTDEQTCEKINKHGFNRSFCGKNATAYGNGTYFAVSAAYSAQPQYAKPNVNGIKHVYVTKVLVGDYTRGSHGMITPPTKPNNPDQLYDCVVDNIAQPGIYVIFHDAQAYPEYLIKFS